MKFSIIIPVYNKELFLRKAIESVLNQTYNKKENVEIVLINDGSTDESHSICEEYLYKFPSEIKYIRTENRGPSAARNYGISLVSKNVDVVGFLDADDYLDNHVLDCVFSFLQENCVDLVTLPVRYFNSKGIGSEHSLNYRFNKGDKVFNIHKQYNAIHFYTGGLFIKRKRLIENVPFFDESLHFWEDAYSINKYLLQHPIYGVVSGAYYYYRRKEKDNNSMVDEYWGKKERYTDLVNNGYSALIKQSISLYGEVLPFIQYLIIFHMKLYLFNNNYKIMKTVLSKTEIKTFLYALHDVLQYINPYYIKNQNTKIYYKSFLLCLKRDGWPMEFKLEKEEPFREEVIIKRKKLTMRGLKIRGYLSEDYYLMQPEDSIYIMSRQKKIRSTTDIKAEKESVWEMPIKKTAGTEFEIIVPYHLLNFSYYLVIGSTIVKLNSFNYYKRFIRKIIPN